MAIRYVNRGEDVGGKELTRTEFRVLFTGQADTLRQQLREVLDQATLGTFQAKGVRASFAVFYRKMRVSAIRSAVASIRLCV